MNVLIACEESQRVCISFREKGHNAFSCDIQPCSGKHPEWHIKGDALRIINGHCAFTTMNGDKYILNKEWDLIIAHPPCTYLTISGNRWYSQDKYGKKALKREENRQKAIEFFMCFIKAKCEKIAVENPVGIMSSIYKKPTQIIQPYFFGEYERKATCLWLKNLPKLKTTKIVRPQTIKLKNGKTDSLLHFETARLPSYLRAKERSKTFWGIAKAMANQWG